MEGEVKGKLEEKKTVSMYLEEIPIAVHKRLLTYRNDLRGKHRRREFTVKQAYVEFLKEKSKLI